MDKNYEGNPVVKSILVILDNLYKISFELGEEACNTINKYRGEKVEENLRKETLEEVTNKDGSVDLNKFNKELIKKNIINSVKDIGWD